MAEEKLTYKPHVVVRKKGDLFVLTKAKDLAKYIITVTEKSPKKFRFTLVTRLQNYILDVLEHIHLANTADVGSDERKAHQKEAERKLQLLDTFSQLASEQECILFKQYEFISKETADCLLYLRKWVTSDKKRVLSE